MFSLAKEIFEAESTGNSWTWEDFEAVFEVMSEDEEDLSIQERSKTSEQVKENGRKYSL